MQLRMALPPRMLRCLPTLSMPCLSTPDLTALHYPAADCVIVHFLPYWLTLVLLVHVAWCGMLLIVLHVCCLT